VSKELQDGPELIRGYVKGVSHKDRIAMMEAELYRGTQTFKQADRYADLLRFMAFQPKRSFRNQILIWLQHPSAQLVLGKTDWKKHFKTSIAKDSWNEPIWIFAPVFGDKEVKDLKTGKVETRREMVNVKPVTVYAQDQIDGEVPGLTPHQLDGTPPKDIWDTLVKYCATEGYRVVMAVPSGGAQGDTDPATKLVRISPRQSPMNQLAVLGHEAFHIKHGHVKDMEAYRLHRGTAELEAEGSTFLFFAAHGIETGTASFEYMHSWSEGNATSILATATASATAASQLIEQVYGPQLNDKALVTPFIELGVSA
jgi:hypothetical protein